jgi:RecB family exonuclease
VVVVGSTTLAAHLNYRFACADLNLLNVRFLTLHRFASDLADQSNPRLPHLTPPERFAYTLASIRLSASTIASLPSGGVLTRSLRFPGFVRALCRTFTDLDEAGIDILPAASVAGKESVEGRLSELGTIRRNYLALVEQFGNERSIYTVDNEFAARFSRIYAAQRLIFYGFYDFTELQERFIGEAARRIPSSLYIPYQFKGIEPAPAYEFADGLYRRLTQSASPESLTENSAGGYSSSLFDYDFRGESFPLTPDRLQVIRAAEPYSEIRAIVGRIVELVFEKQVSPDRIGVVLWQPEQYRMMVTEQLREAGVPVSDCIGLRMSDTAPARVLKALITLDPELVPRRGLMDLLQMPGLKLPPGWKQNGGLPEKASLLTGIVKGSPALWVEALSKVAEREKNEELQKELHSASHLLGAFIQRMSDSCRTLRESRDVAESAHALKGIAMEFLDPGVETDRLVESIRSLESSSISLPDYKLDDFLQILDFAISSVRTGVGTPIADGVWLVTPMTARGVAFDYLFLPGLSSESVPTPALEDPLLPDSIRRLLNRQLSNIDATPLRLKQTRATEERLLFGLAIDSGSIRTTLSYPSQPLGQSKQLQPSRYILEACRMVTGESLSVEDIQLYSNFHDYQNGDFGPGWENRLDKPDDYPLRWALAQGGNHSSLVRKLYSGRSSSYERLCLQAAGHGRGKEWSRFEGMLEKAAALKGDETLSVTELEAWAACPYRALLNRRWRLEPWEEPELVLEIPPQAVGSIIHKVLEGLYQQAEATGRLPLSQSLHLWWDEAVEETFSALRPWMRSEWPAPEVVWRMAETALLKRLKRAGRYLAQLDEGFRFRSSEQRIEGSLVVISESGNRVSVRLRGRIDRLDQSTGGPGIRVIDYKSGKISDPADLKRGEQLQLPVYLRLLLEASAEYDPWSSKAAYWQINERGKIEELSLDGDWLAQNQAQLDQTIAVIVNGMRNGHFPPLRKNKDACTYCPVNAACDWRSRVAGEWNRDDARMNSLLQLRDQE